jgi:hypothetical protein
MCGYQRPGGGVPETEPAHVVCGTVVCAFMGSRSDLEIVLRRLYDVRGASFSYSPYFIEDSTHGHCT